MMDDPYEWWRYYGGLDQASEVGERSERDRELDQIEVTATATFLVGFLLAVGLLWLASKFGSEVLDWAKTWMAPMSLKFALSAIGLGAAAVLFIIRRLHQAAYGGLEIAVAASILWHVAGKAGSFENLDAYATVTGVYVAVRGAVNVDEHMKKRRGRALFERRIRRAKAPNPEGVLQREETR
jgi:hypothetical protein